MSQIDHHPLHKDIKKKITNCLFFDLPSSTHAETRVTKTFSATSGYIFEEDSEIRIPLPKANGNYLNGNALRWVGTAKCSGAGVRWSTSVDSLVKHWVIYGPGNVVIESSHQYSQFHGIMADFTIPQAARDTYLGIEAGFGEVEDRKKYAVEMDFSISLLSNFFRNYCLIPLEFGPFELVITLQKRAEALTVDSGEGYFAISKSGLQCELLTFSPKVDKSVLSAYVQNRINLHVPAWTWHSYTSDSQSLALRIPNTWRSASMLLVYMRNSSDVNNFLVDQTKRTKSFLDSVEISIGKDTFEIMNRESQFWNNTKRALQYNVDGPISYKTYGTRFGGSGEAFCFMIPLQSDDSQSYISGRHDKSQIEINVTHKQQPVEDIVYTVYLLRDRIVNLNPTNGATVIE